MNDPNAGIIQILRRTQPWVNLVSIFGFICVGLMALLAGVSWVGIASDRVEQIPVAALLVYPVLLVLYFVPSFYLFKYGRRIKTFVAQGHTVQLEAALEAQRAFWRFVGIIVVVSAGLTALVIVFAMIAGIMGRRLI